MEEIEKAKVERIKAAYEEKKAEDGKVEKLIALDKKVNVPARVGAYVYGSVSSLVLGTGMCFALGAIGSSMPLGIAIGTLGIALCALTYPLYKAVLKKRKQKYAKQILELSDEILNK